MITWGFMVSTSKANDKWATVVACPDTGEIYAALAVRLRAGGLTLVKSPHWRELKFDATTCLVTVEDEQFTQIHTGHSRLVATERQQLTPLWLTAASRGRVVLVLVPPGTLSGVPIGTAARGSMAERWAGRIDDLAEHGGVLAGFATVIEEPAPSVAPR